jgi:hypothetical protein
MTTEANQSRRIDCDGVETHVGTTTTTLKRQSFALMGKLLACLTMSQANQSLSLTYDGVAGWCHHGAPAQNSSTDCKTARST